MTTHISTEAPAELFKTLVEEAVDHQGIVASRDSMAYLVLLLDSFVRPEDRDVGSGPNPALAELLLSALPRQSQSDLTRLRFAGDLALFRAGFYADGLADDHLGPHYYFRMGSSAYASLAQRIHAVGAASLFGELAAHFAVFVDVLNEVAENCASPDDSDLLRLYARWEQTRSPRTAARLRARGIPLDGASEAIH